MLRATPNTATLETHRIAGSAAPSSRRRSVRGRSGRGAGRNPRGPARQLVISIRDQKITPDQQLRFARRWGEIHLHPFMQGMDELPEILGSSKGPGQEELRGILAHRPDVLAAARDGHDAVCKGGAVGGRRHDVHQPVPGLRGAVGQHEGDRRPAAKVCAPATISGSATASPRKRATTAR